MTTPPAFDVRYDRRVDPQFLNLFAKGGALASLARIAKESPFPLDFQLRKNPKRPSEQKATLYVGLTSVLDVHKTVTGVRFDAHPTWSGKKTGKSPFGFRHRWLSPLTLDELASETEAIELYLEKVIPHATASHGLTEGAVQAVVSKCQSSRWAMLDREVVACYRDAAYKQDVLERCMRPILAIQQHLSTVGGKFPAVPPSLGAECDLLAVDRQGGILAIEVKPAKGGAVAWVPAQAAMYASLLQHWIEMERNTKDETARPPAVINGMLKQRQALGYSKNFMVALPPDLEVTPVVVLQRGASTKQLEQMHKVRELIRKHVQLPAIEVYEVSILGEFKPLT